MTLLPQDKMELAKQEFGISRDRITSIFHSQVNYVQDGLRGTSEKQFNFNLSILSISIVMIGVVIPIALQSNLPVNHLLLRLGMYGFIATFILGFILCIYSPYKDREDLKALAKTQAISFGKQLELIRSILNKANNGTLTLEDISTYNDDSIEENKDFTQKTEPKKARLLDATYYFFLTLFLIALALFVVSILKVV